MPRAHAALTNRGKTCKITRFPATLKARFTTEAPLNARRYGVPEIAAIAATVAAAALLVIFAPGWLKILAVLPLVFCALVAAYGSLRRAWKTWKKIAEYVVMPIGWVFLTIGFAVGVGLTALIARIFGVKMLDMKFEERKTYWVEKPRKEATLENAERQF